MNALPTLPCLCSSFRRTSRGLTQLYERALRPSGLRATQFTILQALSLTGEIPQGRLGRILVMDSTTLTRTLAIMKAQGWVADRPGDDQRERWFRLTKAGASLFTRASRAWEQVQSTLRQSLGTQTWNSLMRLNDQVTLLTTRRLATKRLASK
jgi:DNA-binding MarR family transcriptional regulator